MQGLSEFLCYIFVHCSLQNHEACLKKHVVGRPGIWLIISSAWEILAWLMKKYCVVVLPKAYLWKFWNTCPTFWKVDNYWSLVTQRVSNSRVWVRHGFQLPGPGSGPVFVNFQNRVRVLPCRVSGFCRVSNLCQKVTFLKEKQSWKKFF